MRSPSREGQKRLVTAVMGAFARGSAAPTPGGAWICSRGAWICSGGARVCADRRACLLLSIPLRN